jgi:hypothetical protein
VGRRLLQFRPYSQGRVGLGAAGKAAHRYGSQFRTEKLAEEIERMGRRDRRELRSRLRVLVAHLLKWQAQPGHRSASWSATIREQRKQIARQLRDSPSLRPVVDEVLVEIYADAREHAARETLLPEDDFPPDCAFIVDNVLAQSFLPE